MSPAAPPAWGGTLTTQDPAAMCAVHVPVLDMDIPSGAVGVAVLGDRDACASLAPQPDQHGVPTYPDLQDKIEKGCFAGVTVSPIPQHDGACDSPTYFTENNYTSASSLKKLYTQTK